MRTRLDKEMRFRNGVNEDIWRMRRFQGFRGVDVRDDAGKERGRVLETKRELALLRRGLTDTARLAMCRRQAD